MSANFEPIKIVTLDSNRTRQSPTASGLRLMYLKLSQTPADAWEQLFENQRRFPRSRKSWKSKKKKKLELKMSNHA
jgi:hypothetical protein